MCPHRRTTQSKPSAAILLGTSLPQCTATINGFIQFACVIEQQQQHQKNHETSNARALSRSLLHLFFPLRLATLFPLIYLFRHCKRFTGRAGCGIHTINLRMPLWPFDRTDGERRQSVEWNGMRRICTYVVDIVLILFYLNHRCHHHHQHVHPPAAPVTGLHTVCLADK